MGSGIGYYLGVGVGIGNFLCGSIYLYDGGVFEYGGIVNLFFYCFYGRMFVIVGVING